MLKRSLKEEQEHSERVEEILKLTEKSLKLSKKLLEKIRKDNELYLKIPLKKEKINEKVKI